MDQDDSALSAAAEQRRRREDRHETLIEVLYACIIFIALWGVVDIVVRLKVGSEAGEGLAAAGWVAIFFVLNRRGRLRERAWEREREQEG